MCEFVPKMPMSMVLLLQPPPLPPTTMDEILINYSCLFGPYIFEIYAAYATFQMKLFAIPVESFQQCLFYSPLSLYLYCSWKVLLILKQRRSFINGNISSLRRAILLLANFLCWISNAPENKRKKGKKFIAKSQWNNEGKEVEKELENK